MRSFGSLLKRLRGTMQAQALARRLGMPKSYIANIEAGRKTPSERQARRILEHGFGLTGDEADRCLLHVLLFDYGVRDEPVREVLIDLIERAKRDPDPGGELERLLELLTRSEPEASPAPRRQDRGEAEAGAAPGVPDHR